jgi:ribosomal protein S18 acetylase RimI-like enzyme
MQRGVELAVAHPADLDSVVKVFGQGQYFAEQLAEPNDTGNEVILARRGEDLMGTVTIGPIGADEGELRQGFPPPTSQLLTHLEVPAPLRSQGIGTWIMRNIEDLVRARGFKCIVLGVDLENDGAARLYRRLDYQLWRERPLATTKVSYLEDGGTCQVPDECLVFFKLI